MTFETLIGSVKKSYAQIGFLLLVSIGAIALGMMLGGNAVLAGAAIVGGVALIVNGAKKRADADNAYALRDATYVTYVGVSVTAGTLFTAGSGFFGFVLFVAGLALIAGTGLLTGIKTVEVLDATSSGKALEEAVDARFAEVTTKLDGIGENVADLQRKQTLLTKALDAKSDKRGASADAKGAVDELNGGAS
ncbi:MAG: hypothetical protein GC134_08585 [Proteobacteria bacterium]|nr:hypothetical protein [Pseudomonadota bacterium]